jgi:hypothetical protein
VEYRIKKDGQSINYDVVVVRVGNSVAANKLNASDGNHCVFYGTIGGTQVAGQYYCVQNGGPYAWGGTTDFHKAEAACTNSPPPPSQAQTWTASETGNVNSGGTWNLATHSTNIRDVTPNRWTGNGDLNSGTLNFDLEVIRSGKYLRSAHGLHRQERLQLLR